MIEALKKARDLIAAARRVTILTGAGISTESGIPDFRGPEGLWTRDPEAEKMATIHYYLNDPEVRRRAWRVRAEGGFFDKDPNEGHRALVHLERSGRLELLVTQNVDGLHQKAGSSPEQVVEIHGTVQKTICMSCLERKPMEHTIARVLAGDPDPRCESCGGILKSAAVYFGEMLHLPDVARAEQAAEACDLMMAVGSTLAVYPAAGLVPMAREAGARLLIINGGPTEMDPMADVCLRGRIGEVLPQLVEGLSDLGKNR